MNCTITISMTDYFELGKKAITDAAESQLEMIEAADEVVYATAYGSSDIFEIALRRVGEQSLQNRFIDPTPEVNPRVERIDQHEEVLTGIIASLEKGDRDFASHLEESQREKFYAEGIAYLHPHWLCLNKQDTKQRMQQAVKEYGIKDAQSKVGTKCGGVLCLGESIFAVYGNLALGNTEHASKILEEMFKLYYDKETGLFRNDYGGGAGPCYLNWDRTASVARALDLSGDGRGREIFEKQKEQMMTEFERESASKYSFNLEYRLVTFAFALDHFGMEHDLESIRASIRNKLYKPEKSKKEKVYFGHDSYNNAMICRLGLGLTGLEKSKPNQFYNP